MNREYVLASGNQGKLREIAQILKPLGFVIHPQSDWQVTEAVEDASTFVENSLIKARHASRCTGLPCLADDSGLVVPALNGEPGIYSARYAGTGANDKSNIDKLLAELECRGDIDRSAYFYCAMVMVTSEKDPAPLIATGRWNGQILDAPRGDGGFGYDPVFGIEGQPGSGGCMSAAELSAVEKAGLSHRGQALRSLVSQLRDRDDSATG
jgi:XTP/dITP diphosphohydrolase